MSSFEPFKQIFLNSKGWKSKRKIILFQSDDWGSIRMPSLRIRSILEKHPLIHVDDPYCNNDTLASPDDLSALFEVLNIFRDKNNRPPVITANCLQANPDFERIRKSNFSEYFFEPIQVTFDRYGNEKSLELWKEGIDKGFFYPQFHGREHLNVPIWLSLLRTGHEGVKLAFDYGVFGVSFKGLPIALKNLQPAWEYYEKDSKEYIDGSILSGLKLFSDFFGFSSKTAIAPNYIWSRSQEKLLIQHGVSSMQGILKQRVSYGEKKKIDYIKRFTTRKESGDQGGYQRRNVFFEPSLKFSLDMVGVALKRIQIAFQMNSPVIIGTHRLNFVGALNEKNREGNLDLLAGFLKEICRRWPDVEFMNAAEFDALVNGEDD